MKQKIKISNTSRANWLNVLPDLQNKKVLKIGTDSIEIIKIIFYCNVASLSCIGAPRDELQHIVKNYYQNEENIGESFDVVIYDEVNSKDTINNILNYLSKIKGLLNEEGVLLVCCPDGWGNLKNRYYFKKALQIESKGIVKYYISNPSSAAPCLIIPYIKDKAWLTYNYPNIEETSFNVKVVFKEIIKKYIFKNFGIYDPLNGLIITLNNTGIMNVLHEQKEIANTNGGSDNDPKALGPLVTIYVAFHYLNKHYLFSYGQFDKKLKCMKKIEYNPAENGSYLEKEHKNLLLFKEYIDMYDSHRIVIPQAVYFNKLDNRHESSMTVVKGVSLKYLVEKSLYQNNFKSVTDLLTRATDMQICFQELTENNIKEVIYNQDPDYYLNYLGLDLGDINIERVCIQHCDFAANNIHLDIETNKWGIIDWEGLSQGMPPLLDLISMFTSFRFTIGKKKYKKFQEKYYDAIIDTYFSNNWISRCVLKNLKKYCLAHKISEKNIYSYFVLFLIFQCNKYRIYKMHDYQLIFEKMLRYTIENKEKFIACNSTSN